MAEEEEEGVEVTPATRARAAPRRTPSEIFDRYTQLEKQAVKRQWNMAIYQDNVPIELSELERCPDDCFITLTAGPPTAHSVVSETFRLMRKGKEEIAESASLVREVGRFLQMQQAASREAAALAERSLVGLGTLVDSANKLAKMTAKSIKKRAKLQRQLAEVTPEDKEGVVELIEELVQILGVDGVKDVVSSVFKGKDTSPHKPKRRPARRKKAPS